MDKLYEGIKKARLRCKPDDFAAYLEEHRAALTAAAQTATPKKLLTIGTWAVKHDVLPVIQCIAGRLDFTKLVPSIICNAWHTLQWATQTGRIPLPLTMGAPVRNLSIKVTKSGDFERLDWIAANTANFVASHLSAAIYSKKLEIVAWYLDHGARWDHLSREGMLSVGFIEALDVYSPAAEDFGNRYSALLSATSGGHIAAVEWVLRQYYPLDDFDPWTIINPAIICGHESLLRWLHETKGTPAEVFRVGPRGLSIFQPLQLSVMKRLHEICDFSHDEVSLGCAELLKRAVTNPIEKLEWIQGTFQFTLAEVRAGDVLYEWVRTGNAWNVLWLLKNFEWESADWMRGDIIHMLVRSSSLLPALKWLHQAEPFTPDSLLRVCPDMVTKTVKTANNEGLVWLHDVVGVRSNDACLVHHACELWYNKLRLSVLQTLSGTYGIDRLQDGRGAANLLNDADLLTILHDKFGATVELLRNTNWDSFYRIRSDICRVITETYGMSCRELRMRIAGSMQCRARVVPLLVTELGMDAEDWRRDDYALLRPRVQNDRWCGTWSNVLKLLFGTYGLTAADATALLTTNEISTGARRFLKKQERA